MSKPAYLIDTDWVIDHLNQVKEVKDKIAKYADKGLAISIITYAELYEGIFYATDRKKAEKKLQEFLKGVEVISIDEKICKIFAQERGRLRRKKSMIDNFDLMIASTCLVYKMTLLTNNIKHFQRISDLTIESILKSAKDCFKEGWNEAMKGNTKPISEL